MKFDDYKKRTPFKVPDGYFENLADNIMKKLPQEPRKDTHRPRVIPLAKHIHHIRYAATIAIVFFLSTMIFVNTNEKTTIAATSSNELYSDEYIDELLDNYTFDDYTFYCCLTDNN